MAGAVPASSSSGAARAAAGPRAAERSIGIWGTAARGPPLALVSARAPDRGLVRAPGNRYTVAGGRPAGPQNYCFGGTLQGMYWHGEGIERTGNHTGWGKKNGGDDDILGLKESYVGEVVLVGVDDDEAFDHVHPLPRMAPVDGTKRSLRTKEEKENEKKKLQRDPERPPGR